MGYDGVWYSSFWSEWSGNHLNWKFGLKSWDFTKEKIVNYPFNACAKTSDENLKQFKCIIATKMILRKNSVCWDSWFSSKTKIFVERLSYVPALCATLHLQNLSFCGITIKLPDSLWFGSRLGRSWNMTRPWGRNLTTAGSWWTDLCSRCRRYPPT